MSSSGALTLNNRLRFTQRTICIGRFCQQAASLRQAAACTHAWCRSIDYSWTLQAQRGEYTVQYCTDRFVLVRRSHDRDREMRRRGRRRRGDVRGEGGSAAGVAVNHKGRRFPCPNATPLPRCYFPFSEAILQIGIVCVIGIF